MGSLDLHQQLSLSFNSSFSSSHRPQNGNTSVEEHQNAAAERVVESAKESTGSGSNSYYGTGGGDKTSFILSIIDEVIKLTGEDTAFLFDDNDHEEVRW